MKTVVVTGASRGFGRSLAVAFSAEAKVIAIGRDEDALQETAALSTEGQVQPVVLDLRDEKAVREFFSSLDSPDILVNNAGIAHIKSLLDSSADDLREILETNVVAAFVVMREAARAMVEKGGGHIINIASDAALHGIVNMSSYVASKHALLGISRSVHMELKDKGVRVTTFNPGPIDTLILGPGILSNGMSPDDLAQVVVRLAQTPKEIAIHEVLVQPSWI